MLIGCDGLWLIPVDIGIQFSDYTYHIYSIKHPLSNNRPSCFLIRNRWPNVPQNGFRTLKSLYIWATGWQKGSYGKIWKFTSDEYFENTIHSESFLKIAMIYH